MPTFDMKTDWDARARKDSLFATACDDGKDEKSFVESGRRDAAIIFEGVPALLPSRESALEIGCGVGRLLEPLAGEFRELYGVDVSGEMIRQAQERLANFPNVQAIEVAGDGHLPFEDARFDFCFSYITFHHIPQKNVVLRYITEARRVLKPRGLFRFQLFGRQAGTLAAVRERVTKKSTWRGCKFTLPEIVAVTRQSQFEIIEARYVNPSPEKHSPFFGKSQPHLIWVTARKPAAATPPAG